MVKLDEDNVVIKKIEGGSIISHAPLFSEDGRLVTVDVLRNFFVGGFLIS
jgi:hypothetical protein